MPPISAMALGGGIVPRPCQFRRGMHFDLTEAIKKRFDEVGISFPFPQQDVHLYQQPGG